MNGCPGEKGKKVDATRNKSVSFRIRDSGSCLCVRRPALVNKGGLNRRRNKIEKKIGNKNIKSGCI